MNVALEHSDMQMVQWLHQYFPCGLVRQGLNAVASHGDWSLVEWLYANHGGEKLDWVGTELKAAATHHRLDIMKWLHSHTALTGTVLEVEIAARNGNLKMLQ